MRLVNDPVACAKAGSLDLDDGERPAIAALPAYPRDLPVHEVFTWYARRTPDRPAVVSDGGCLSYGELDARTNRFARRLASLGAGPGKVVGLLTNRSVDTIVAWLATLKCGAAYMPLDPAYPESALEYMIEDCRPAIVLGERSLIEAGMRIGGTRICVLEDEIAACERESAVALSIPVSAMDTAYLMYTSGSTGRPKGVIVPHRGIVRLVRDQNYMEFDDSHVFLFVSALAFDVSTLDVWGPLLNGSRIAVVSGARLSIDQIGAAIKSHGVSVVTLTSALFHMIVDEDVEALRGVRHALVAGDIISPEHATKAMARLPDCELINAYGPTEATTYCVCYRLPRNGWGGGSVPIGKPISHAIAYILDENRQPVADGEVGLLWTAGDGVAAGYLNRPDLTAERFVTDPFRNDGSLMYLTGDLVRMRTDGNIEFLGRNDRQVKINGKRIELDEIELNLRRDGRLADAIVVLRQLGVDDKKIAAFLKPAKAPAEPGLREAVLVDLRAVLPGHMIPHETAIVEEFPLTPNGKVDRPALLAIPTTRVAVGAATEIKGDTQKRVAEIWARVLKLPYVDPNANFFDLGGTSLQMVRIHAELKKVFVRDLSITDLFAKPRVAELAQFMDGVGGNGASMAEARSRATMRSQMMRRAQRTVRKSS